MAKEMTGTVIEKSFRPPPGAPDKYWCYLMVESESGKRVTIRMHQKRVDHVTIGDSIRFSKPWRKNKRVKHIEMIERAKL